MGRQLEAEDGFEVTASMDHAQDLNAVLLDGVDDDVLRYGEAAHTWAELAAAANIG